MDIEDFSSRREPSLRALIPFAVFLLFYLGLSIVWRDFYKVPMPVAFLVASATAMVLNHRASLRSKVELFAHGMGDVDIMTMCLIFILAGAFAHTAQEMGAVGAAVKIALAFVPPHLLVAGLFLVACFVSLSIGTSVGTILALAPIAMGFSQNLGFSGGLTLGVVVGGAMFGDNLSMISDTTIAATRTQRVDMRDKFRANLVIVIPAALLTIGLYLLTNPPVVGELSGVLSSTEWFKVLPYLAVLLLALAGVNVMALLLFGTVAAGIIGICCGSFSFSGFLGAVGEGAMGMSETLIVALLAGGLLKVIRYNGGIDYLLNRIERHIRNRRGGEFGMALLLAVVNVFTANNTVAIVITGPIAKDISDRYKIAPARSASILDTTSCIVQGMLPYGAQVLGAVGVTRNLTPPVTAFDILAYLWYPYMLAVFLLLSILFEFPRRSESRS